MDKSKILVADDSPTIQKVFELALEKENIDLLLAGDGESAFAMVQENRPDIVIVDVNMPGISGFEFCARLKEETDTARIPVYLLASALDEFDQEQADKVGAAGKMEKPFRSEDMVNSIQKALEDARNAPEPEPLPEPLPEPTPEPEPEIEALPMVFTSDDDDEPETTEEAKEDTPAEEPENEFEDTDVDDFEDFDVSLDVMTEEPITKEQAAEEPVIKEYAPAEPEMDEEEMGEREDVAPVEQEENDPFNDTSSRLIIEIEKEDIERDESSLAQKLDDDVDYTLSEEEKGEAAQTVKETTIPNDEPVVITLDSTLIVDEEEEDETFEVANDEEEFEEDELDDDDLDEEDEPGEREEFEESGFAPDDVQEVGPPDSEVDDESDFSMPETDKIMQALNEEESRIKRSETIATIPVEEESSSPALTSAAIERKIDTAIRNAVSFLEEGRLEVVVDRSVKKSVQDAVDHDRIEQTLDVAIRETINSMKPQIMEIFRKVATDITLNIAEDLVKQTIDQIKSGD